MGLDIVRDSIFGNLVNLASGGKLLPFPDQRKDYEIPQQYLPRHERSPPSSPPGSRRPSDPTPAGDRDNSTLVDESGVCKREDSTDKGSDIEKGTAKAKPTLDPAAEAEPTMTGSDRPDYLVDWLENDQENPHNWSPKKRYLVATLIAFMTTGVYIGSAIFTSGEESIMTYFGVIQVVATLGLSLFILGYGIGPMFLAPLQDVVSIGRNPIYVGGLFLFVLFQVPVIFAPNIGTILVFRFFAGFVGSPALATGGTSMTELFPMHVWPYAIGIWSIGAVCGPVFGPVIGGFAAQANGWRWPIYELLWVSGTALLVLFFLLPETNEKTILHRRAARLRKLTGNPRFMSHYEMERHEGETIFRAVRNNFVIGLKVAADPAIGFANFYIGLVYSIFYLWFETFPIVFSEIHGFSLGVAGLPYLGFVVSAVITFTFYCWYQHAVMAPRMRNDPNFGPETRLELGLGAAFFIPISLFMFGWGAKAHWMVPIVGAALYFPGIFLLFQSILMFVSMYAKPEYNSSVMASNTFFRSSFAAAFPLFGSYYVKALGVGGACSLLAGVSLIMIPILYLLYRNGRRLRNKSKWANHDADK